MSTMKTAALAVPRTQIEAEALLLSIGKLQREHAAIELRMNDRLATIQADHAQQAQPLNAAIEEQFQALHAWAEAHREELLAGKGKTVQLATGELSWRTSPPSVRVTHPAVAVETLKRLGLGDLVRVKEEINKEAILADPDRVHGIGGIRVLHPETFVAKPFESEIERAEPVKRALRESPRRSAKPAQEDR